MADSEGADAQFAVFFRNEADRAIRIAYLLCGDLGQAEDAVAESFARVLVQWRRGRVNNPGEYLRRAVVNELRSGWRRATIGRRLAGPWTPGNTESAASDDAVGDHDRIVAALRRVAPRQREALVLRYFGDLTEADTAAAMRCSVGSVKSQVARGLARLRVLLEEEVT